MQKHEIGDRVMSYGAGGAGITAAKTLELTSVVQEVTIWLGLLLILVRLAYDGLKLYRAVKRKGGSDE